MLLRFSATFSDRPLDLIGIIKSFLDEVVSTCATLTDLKVKMDAFLKDRLENEVSHIVSRFHELKFLNVSPASLLL